MSIQYFSLSYFQPLILEELNFCVFLEIQKTAKFMHHEKFEFY